MEEVVTAMTNNELSAFLIEPYTEQIVGQIVKTLLDTNKNSNPSPHYNEDKPTILCCVGEESDVILIVVCGPKTIANILVKKKGAQVEEEEEKKKRKKFFKFPLKTH